ncbi:hypothetical protein [Acetobacter sp. DsW_063]|uniref:hypothetical protein n=1 Tax=Acetobacter sp. DsW_063 TaxID=1514894 RepID=UPI000A3D22AD|nr:hypothetical protein [Acetobacter sp. DsW_063]OUJ17072.1 hypothetical protein HK28_07845 [Acetobacter sp. DsW_063]
MSSKLATVLATVYPILNAILPSVAGSKLQTYQTIAQTAVKAAVTSIDGGIDNLTAAYAKFESDNPVFAAAVVEFRTLATALGVSVPTEDAVVTHLKAAVADLAGILVPVSSTDAPVPASDVSAAS